MSCDVNRFVGEVEDPNAVLQASGPEVGLGKRTGRRRGKIRTVAIMLVRGHDDKVGAEFDVDLVAGEVGHTTKGNALVEFEVGENGIEQVRVELGIERDP